MILFTYIIHSRALFPRVEIDYFLHSYGTLKVNLLSQKMTTTGSNLQDTGLSLMHRPNPVPRVRELLRTVDRDNGCHEAYLLNTMIPRSERSSFISSKVSWTSNRCRVLRWAAKVSFLVSATVLELPISMGHRYQGKIHILQVAGQPLN